MSFNPETKFATIRNMIEDQIESAAGDEAQPATPELSPLETQEVDRVSLMQAARRHNANMRLDTKELMALREEQETTGGLTSNALSEDELREKPWLSDERLTAVRDALRGDSPPVFDPLEHIDNDSFHALAIARHQSEIGRQDLAKKWGYNLKNADDLAVFEARLSKYVRYLRKQGALIKRTIKGQEALKKLDNLPEKQDWSKDQ
jgi:hypothetical protein